MFFPTLYRRSVLNGFDPDAHFLKILQQSKLYLLLRYNFYNKRLGHNKS